MGAPLQAGLPPLAERFPQWSRTAVLAFPYDDDVIPAIQVKKSHSGELLGNSLLLGASAPVPAQDYAFRVAHLEQSIRFLQEQHQLMLSGLHKEIESLRERNRDLQFQLIFNKDSPSKSKLPSSDESPDNSTKEAEAAATAARGEAAAARGEARAAEARALQLQQLVDAQTEKLRALEVHEREGCASCGAGGEGGRGGGGEGGDERERESPSELRARLADAERLVRRLRTDADRQRREVLAGGVTNLLFDDAAAHAAHLQCMKNSLTASLRVAGADVGFSNHGYQPQNYHFPPLHRPDFWPEPHREEFHMMNGRGRGRRPVTLPELQTNGHQIHQSTVYANHHTRQRPNGYDHQQRNERKRGSHHNNVLNEAARAKSIDAQSEGCASQQADYAAPANPTPAPAPAAPPAGRSRGKRNHHRKAASTDHT